MVWNYSNTVWKYGLELWYGNVEWNYDNTIWKYGMEIRYGNTEWNYGKVWK